MHNTIVKKINGKFAGVDILSLDQFTPQDVTRVLKIAKKLKPLRVNGKPSKILVGKIITLLFYEPSTRTCSSFSSAAQQLGAGVITIQDASSFSSVAKGESLLDTISTLESYSDLIVMRHPEAGSAMKAAETSLVPVINAGDGAGSHPTQALLDLFTIFDKFKRLDNLKILICGDILHSRTIHSLIEALSLFKKNSIFLLSTKELSLDVNFSKKISSTGTKLTNIHFERDIPKDVEVWYWNRIQKERFKSLKDYKKHTKSFVLTKRLLDSYGNKNMIIIDPLPRVGEISHEVDSDPRALYLKEQMRNGVYVRMALLSLLLGKIK